MSTNQAASTGPAAATTPAPQNLLGPVPLSGIPVLIAGRALAGSNHFDIRLDPPELGRIEVRLKVDRDGQVSSHLIADRPDTLALLRRDQTGLERAL
jgi:flagellar hook-length control protein FliK